MFFVDKVVQPLPSLCELRTKALNSLKTIRIDHKRALNPTPYKVFKNKLKQFKYFSQELCVYSLSDKDFFQYLRTPYMYSSIHQS